MLSTLSFYCSRCKEIFNIVIGTAYAYESERKLKTHVTGLESLRANHNQFLVLEVSNDESVRRTDYIVVVNVLRFLELRID